ncbi:RHS repeat-associated core domain-containing protein [Pseudomonas oryziphila]|uniref:RHS repeat protein n=2 Tax=Pseudomonas TaxID=286 RepID=A0ABN5TGW1_9PSED|nr:RHS repeat-associated core domain-containing protein [Pseudomonas oryziphila]AZL73602.1 RHS repeat protein [Pseudomonas oryziphila]
MTTLTEHDVELAIAPLETLLSEDLGLAAAAVNDWLHGISGGLLDLQTLRNLGENTPVVANALAAVDVLADLIELVEHPGSDPLLWASLGINLIGVVPFPPGMAIPRRVLRPVLQLTRQTLRRRPGARLDAVLLEILEGHLHASIRGELENFISGALQHLPEMLAQAGELAQALLRQLARALDDLAKGRLDDQASRRMARQQLAQVALYDSALEVDAWLLALAALGNAAEGTFKQAYNSVAGHLSGELEALFKPLIATLESLAEAVPKQLAALGQAERPHSIAWLLTHLLQTVQAHPPSRRLAINIKPNATAQARMIRSEGPTEVARRQGRANKQPKPEKNGPCACTGFSIGHVLGDETLAHQDFSLPGPFPVNWTRVYNSRLAKLDDGSLGARWITEFTTFLDTFGQGLVLHDADGRIHELPLPKVGKHHHDAIEYLTLVRTAEQQLVLLRGLDRRETYAREGDRFYLTHIQLRSGAGAMLHYEHQFNGRPVLSDINTYSDNDPEKLHLQLGTLLDDHGHIQGLWQVVDGTPLRQLCGYHYDTHGDLTAAQDEHGAAWQYQYRQHLITRYTDRTGRGINLEWDGNGPHAKAIHEWADDGSFETRLAWDPNIRLTYVTDAHGQETWHYYDALGYTYRLIHPDGREEWLFRDPRKNVIRHVHPDGSQDRYTYDERSNLLQHIRADHSTVHYAYDDHDQPIKLRDAEGGLWLRDYDERGNLVESVDPLGNKTEFAYTPAGLVKAIKDALGNEKTLAYNDAGQLLEYTDCSGKSSAWAYNTLGQLTDFTDAAGYTTAYEYQAGQLAKVTHPDKTEERFNYDAEGRLLAHVDALERCTTWAYSAAGLLSERIDANEHTLRYRWDKLGRLIGLENENASKATFLYDPVGRLLQETGFDGLVTRYQYDTYSGRLASTQVGQRRIELTFDPMGRLSERTARLGNQSQSETFAYDGNGQLIQAVNAASKLQWFFDEAGNLTREHQYYVATGTPMVAVWQHQYDALNQRTATIRPDGHKVSWLTYGSGHLLGMTLDQHEMLAYERDDLHREIVRHQGNKLMQTQAWDPAGRLQEQLLGSHDGQSTLLKRQYRYDAASQLTNIHDSRRGQLEYQYDPVGRLLKATSRLGVETFAFDPAGNLLDQKTQELNRPLEADPRRNKLMDNLLREYAGTHYKYDERGNLIHRLHNGSHAHFTWDLFDRLASYNDDKLKVDYSYDALGRRLHKHSVAHFWDRPEAGTGWNQLQRAKRQRELGCGFTLFGWDGDTLAWESSPPLDEGDTGRTVHYLYEPGSFVPVAQALRKSPIRLHKVPDWSQREYDFEQDPLWHTEVKPQPFEAIAWYHCDHLGTPMELTDEQGNVAWAGQYKAWGEVREERSAWAKQHGLGNPIRFQGQYHDHETGLHYNRYRYFDFQLGRFISSDPIKYSGGLNLFVYSPNPISWIDPLGLSKKMGDTVCSCEICPDKPKEIDPRNLRSRQSRAEMSRNKVDKLASRMRKNGYDHDHPVDVAEVNGQIIIIDGHHRAQAASKAGMPKAPVIVHEVDPEVAKKLENDMYESRCS